METIGRLVIANVTEPDEVAGNALIRRKAEKFGKMLMDGMKKDPSGNK
jgi:hypothetical protein